jgi:FlaA1/EpsC-like NDP-sugar epimerase
VSRIVVQIAVQASLAVLSSYLAFWIRFDGAVPTAYTGVWLAGLPLLLVTRVLAFGPFSLYAGVWRYTGIFELRSIAAAVTVSSLAFALIAHWTFRQPAYPRSVLILDAVLLFVLLGGVRLLPRIAIGLRRSRAARRVLIYGAGNAGESIVRDMKRNPSQFEPVGFIDDDASKVGLRIHGVRVLGTRTDLVDVIARRKPSEVLVAMPRVDAATVRSVVRALEPFDVRISTLPSLRDIVDGRVAVSQIRALALDDLLQRPPVALDLGSVQRLIRGRRVLVTGAAGSIGSELCRQLVRCEPAHLVLLDKDESALHRIDVELQRDAGNAHVALLGDVKHVRRLCTIFAEHRPQIVLHAAAYKHVPIMQCHPDEAVLNNVSGTRRLCETAVAHGVETFALISSDKAVNPTSVMGATKRIGELYLQAMARDAAGRSTVFCGVRFGNVLGSNGSVVPLFLEQIRRGGPVTITDPEVARYFMSVGEACALVLRAVTLARGGEIFVLEMGEQIRIADLARHLIRLSGFVPESDIALQYVGLRPGEKLTEELVGTDESAAASPAEKIRRIVPARVPPLPWLVGQLDELERLAERGDTGTVVELLERLTLAKSLAVPVGRRPPAVPVLPAQVGRDPQRMAG